MSLVATPAFASCSMPSAASLAENAVSAPALIAAARISSMFAAVSCVAALTPDIALSKFAVAATIAPRPAAATKPTLPAAPPTEVRPVRNLSPSLPAAVSLFPRSLTPAPAAVSEDLSPEMSPRKTYLTTLSATALHLLHSRCGLDH
jgi:hypothetical protein